MLVVTESVSIRKMKTTTLYTLLLRYSLKYCTSSEKYVPIH